MGHYGYESGAVLDIPAQHLLRHDLFEHEGSSYIHDACPSLPDTLLDIRTGKCIMWYEWCMIFDKCTLTDEYIKA